MPARQPHEPSYEVVASMSYASSGGSHVVRSQINSNHLTTHAHLPTREDGYLFVLPLRKGKFIQLYKSSMRKLGIKRGVWLACQP